MIGYTTICFGLSNTIGCVLVSPTVKRIGQTPALVAAAFLDSTAIFLMFFWTNNASATSLLYIIPVLWGMADSVWQSLVKGTILEKSTILDILLLARKL